MLSRIQQFQSYLKQKSLPAYLIVNDNNIRYLTHVPSSESWLLITEKRNYYITDFRYETEIKKQLRGVTVLVYKKSKVLELFNLLQRMHIKILGFDDRKISLNLYKNMLKHRPQGLKLFAKNGWVEKMRVVKSVEEIAQIRAAILLHKKALKYLKKILKPGMSEQAVFCKLERYIRSKNATFSFDPIIASGPHSAFPHAKITDREIQNNECLLIDMGVDINGYKSDLTRMFFFGKIPPLVQETYTKVETAQNKAIRKIKPGEEISVIDGAARNYLKKQSLDKFFGHALGHGIGLDVHEEPRISKDNKTIIKEGMIFTVEPAVYFPRKFGIRIEDMILVTSTGCEVLSQ